MVATPSVRAHTGTVEPGSASQSGGIAGRTAVSPRRALWLAGIGACVTLLGLLTASLVHDPFPAQDSAVLAWIAGWDSPAIDRLLRGASFLTDTRTAVGLGVAGFMILAVFSRIIDLESGFATPFPARGQWRSALRTGGIPVFDDIDFERLKGHVSAHRPAPEASLGAQGVARLAEGVERGERSYTAWKEAEPRVWGRFTRRVYGLGRAAGRLMAHWQQSLVAADQAAVEFLSRGVDRWEEEGRLPSAEAASLRAELASTGVQGAVRHLGVHLVLSALLRFPFGSIARFAWTAGFCCIAMTARFRRRRSGVGRPGANIHSPLVMLLSLVPGFGAVACLASPPLRRPVLVGIMTDQIGRKLPCRAYSRLHLDRWVAPTSTKGWPRADTDMDAAPVYGTTSSRA